MRSLPLQTPIESFTGWLLNSFRGYYRVGDRIEVGGGWFVTPNILVKAEYVTQQHDGYPATDILHEGQFDGFMVEGVIAF